MFYPRESETVYIPEKSKITVEFFDDKQNLETREIIEKIVDKIGREEYWFIQHSNFKEKAFWRGDDGGEETCTIVTSHSKYKQSYNPNIVKPIFDKAVSCLTCLLYN